MVSMGLETLLLPICLVSSDPSHCPEPAPQELLLEAYSEALSHAALATTPLTVNLLQDCVTGIPEHSMFVVLPNEQVAELCGSPELPPGIMIAGCTRSWVGQHGIAYNIISVAEAYREHVSTWAHEMLHALQFCMSPGDHDHCGREWDGLATEVDRLECVMCLPGLRAAGTFMGLDEDTTDPIGGYDLQCLHDIGPAVIADPAENTCPYDSHVITSSEPPQKHARIKRGTPRARIRHIKRGAR